MTDQNKRDDNKEFIEKRGQKLVPTTPPPTQSKDSGSPPAPQKQQGQQGQDQASD